MHRLILLITFLLFNQFSHSQLSKESTETFINDKFVVGSTFLHKKSNENLNLNRENFMFSSTVLETDFYLSNSSMNDLGLINKNINKLTYPLNVPNFKKKIRGGDLTMILIGLAGAAAGVYFLSDDNEDNDIYGIVGGGTLVLFSITMLSL